MKTLKNIRNFGLACLLALGAASCSEDTTFDEQVDLSDSQINVTKRGVDYEGATVNFDVVSNVYWLITNADDYDWLEVSPKAGSNTTTVYVKVDLNAGATRSAELQIETKDGLTRKVQITQAGAEEVMNYLTEGFGESVEGKQPIGAFQQWGYTGAGTTGAMYRYAYSGTNAYVQNANPSSGYEGASGGNSILFEGAGAEFSIKNFNAQSERNFRMSFAAANAEGAFSKEEFRLQISRDNEVWFDMDYDRPQTEGWAVSTLRFNVPENMDCLYFRFMNKVENSSYQLDDVTIVEGTESEQNQVIDFIYVAPGFRGLPATWDFTAITSSDENGQSWMSEQLIVSSQGAQQGSEMSYRKAEAHANNKYDISGGNPRVTGPYLNDAWLFTLPVENMEPNTSVNITGMLRSSAKGNKYYAVDYSTDGQNWTLAPGAQTKDVVIKGVIETTTFHYELIDANTDTQVDKTILFTDAVASGNIYIRVRVSGNATNDLTRFNTASNAGTTRLTGEWAIVVEEKMIGLPAYWSYPSDGLTTGAASKSERFYYSDDFAGMGLNAARIDAVRAVVPSGTTSADMSYTLGADGEIGRILMYGFALDDYWKFTVPVKNLKANTKVNLKTILSSSGSGPKFFIVEYSTDGGVTWKTGSATQSVEDKAKTDTENRTIVYSYRAADSPANADCVVDETITVAEAIKEGNLCLRLRVCDAMACNKAKNIVPANGGTTRMKTKAGVCDRIAITVVE